MKTKFKIFIIALTLGTSTTFLSCSNDDGNGESGDSCAGLVGIELANCRDAQL